MAKKTGKRLQRLVPLAVLCGATLAAAYDPARYVKLASPPDKRAPNSECKKLPPGLDHKVHAAKENGAWGYMADGLQAAATVRSGDTIKLAIPTASGTYAYEEMIEGDKDLEALFRWDENGPAVSTRGAAGAGEGRSWNVGPIHVCSAKPGDILKVEILNLKPRVNPKDNSAYGVLTTNSAGYHNRNSGDKSDMVTVFASRLDKQGKMRYLMPEYQYNWENQEVTTSCVPDEAEYPNTLSEGKAKWTNKDRKYHGIKVPCVNGKQTWGEMSYPGQNVNVDYEKRTFGLAGRFAVKPNLHLGFVGLAPATGAPVNGVAPGRTGGNLDQKRTGVNSTVYLPVDVKGAQLFLGDGHLALGDGQFGGGALDGHLTAEIRVTVFKRKEKATPKWMRLLQGPLIETPSSWVVPGLSQPDYLKSLDNAQTAIMKEGADLNRAMSAAANATTEFIMALQDFDETEAVRFMSYAVDFGVTQVTNGNVAVHAVVDKSALEFFDTVKAIEDGIKEEEDAAAAVAKAEAEDDEEEAQAAAAEAASAAKTEL